MTQCQYHGILDGVFYEADPAHYVYRQCGNSGGRYGRCRHHEDIEASSNEVFILVPELCGKWEDRWKLDHEADAARRRSLHESRGYPW